METLSCTYKKTVYASPNYGPSICVYETADKEPITVTGKFLPVLKKVTFTFEGTWINHPKYGKQFQASTYQESVDSSSEAIVDYLSSGLIKGIGKAMAARIVEHFGTETLSVMDNEIERLSEVKGISDCKLEKITESYSEAKASKEVVVYLAKKGFSPRLAMEVYRKYLGKTMAIIESAPYLLSEIPGISFLTADGLKVTKDKEYSTQPARFEACARYALLMAEVNSPDLQAIIGSRTSGSTGMEKNDFGRCMLTLLKGDGVNEKFICENTVRMIKEKSLIYRKVDGKEVIFSKSMYNTERAIADEMYRLCYSSVKPLDNIEEKIYAAEKALNIGLSLSQLHAVKMVFKYGMSILTGGPGTGKTTTLKTIAWIYEHYEKGSTLFLAPTGRAAARIHELGYEASTIHSALQIGSEYEEDDYEEIFEGPMLIGIDEFSMADARLCCRLLKSIGNGCRVVICGDPDQLPSVGAGAVLRDMLMVESIPSTRLDTVYRTMENGNININCNKIRLGDTNLLTGEGFDIIEEDDIDDIEDTLVLEYLRNIEKYGIENVMMLSPYKEHSAGVIALNEKIQSILHPRDISEKMFLYHSEEQYYRIGDPILNLVNDKDTGICNGDIGYVVDVTKNKDGEDALAVQFQDKLVLFTREQMNNISLAYACTVHKAQGAEFKSVLLPAHRNFSLLYKRNLVYTAVSRGKDKVTIVGSVEALKNGIKEEDKSQRITALKDLLKASFNEFVPVSFAS